MPIVIVVLMVLAAVLAGYAVGSRWTTPWPTLVRACCDDFEVPVTPAANVLISRYLVRTYRYRQAWAWTGVGLSVVSAYLLRSPYGGGWGLVGYPPTSNVFLMALGFWFVGVVRSELYNIRPRYHGARSAGLEVRDVHRYLPPRMVVLPRLTAALAVGLVVVDRALSHASVHASTVVALGVVAVGVLVVTEVCQAGIARRSRPAVGPDLVAADEAIRRMASWTVAYGASGLLSLVAAIQAFLITDQVPVKVVQHLPGGVVAHMATDPGPRNQFVWIGLALFLWSVGLAIQARRMVRPDHRSVGRATAALSR